MPSVSKFAVRQLGIRNFCANERKINLFIIPSAAKIAEGNEELFINNLIFNS